MADMTVKQQALDAVQALPESATFEDVLERLLFNFKSGARTGLPRRWQVSSRTRP